MSWVGFTTIFSPTFLLLVEETIPGARIQTLAEQLLGSALIFHVGL